MGIICKAFAVVLPFGGISVYRPALQEFADAVTVEDLVRGAVEVQPGGWLRFFGGDVVRHDDPMLLEDGD